MPPVVLLHGSMANSASWLGILRDFGPSFSLFCADIPGEPGLSEASRMPLTSDAAARWLEALLDGLGIERAAFLGMSLGSWYALSLATNNPRRVRALSLVTAGGIASQKRGFLAKAILCMMLGERGRRRLAGLVYRKAEVPPVVHEFQALVSAHFRPLLEPLPIFRDGDLRGLKMPLQYFGGDLDVILDTAKTVRRLRALVPHAEVRVLAGTGHVILDKFGEVREFLERN